MHFRYFVIISPWTRAGPSFEKKLESLSPNNALSQVWLKSAQWFLRRIFLLNFVNVFSLFHDKLPLKRTGPFIWTNSNTLHQRMLCVKFGCNWPSGSGEEGFLISTMYFRYFVIILPLEKGGALHLNKLESSQPKDALCQVWMKLIQWFWRRWFLSIFNIILIFRHYTPFEKSVALHLNKHESAPSKDALCQV